MSETITNEVFIALGSNIAPRSEYIQRAENHLKKISQGSILKSPIYETPPLGPGIQRKYLNQVLLLHTILSPLDLLKYCKRGEQLLGRKNRVKWASREIDIDILIYGQDQFQNEILTIPHPEIKNRQFVLRPMLDLNPKLIIPGSNLSVEQMYQNAVSIQGESEIELYNLKKSNKYAPAK